MNDKVKKQRLGQFLHLCFLSCFLLTSCIYATTNPIDGRTNIQYKTANWVLRNTDYALGFVKFNNGVTILNNAGAVFNITEPISIGLDLRETGTINLQGDLQLDSNFTITSNGTICGNKHAIFMRGDLTLSDSTYVRVLHINTNTIIDGCGNSLILGRHAKLFVDDNVTLTLRNMVIKPTFNYYSDPCIKLASSRSKLALEDVKFDLVQDFDFMTGQLFVHNDVAITGTSAFVYNSTQPSFITSGATLYFDLGTTFSVTPATFTAYPYTITSPYVTNNFIQMADQISQLYLNGCSLLSTLTGCRFTNGTINFENKVLINSNTAPTISSSSIVTQVASIGISSNTQSLAWSPDGRYVAVVSPASGSLQIFAFDGVNTLVQIGSSVSTGGSPNCVSWSNDGRFILILNDSNNVLRIFLFSGASSPIQVGSDISAGSATYSATWSPDGRFIATVGYGNDSLSIFSFNGVNTPTLVATTSPRSNPFVVSWSPDGRYIGVVDFASNGIEVFSFDGVSTLHSISYFISGGSNLRAIAWSPDSRFVAFVDFGTSNLWICSFDTVNGLNLVGNRTPMYGIRPQTLTWSPNGKFVAVGCEDGSIDIFSFDGVDSPVHVNSSFQAISLGNNAMTWSPNGKFIAVATYENTLLIFSVNYIADNSTQAMSNGIVFGNSALGASHDPTVNILGGAYVETYGLVNYDCAG